MNYHNDRRYFKAIYQQGNETIEYGRYRGRKPKQAASKALTAICKNLRNKGTDTDNLKINFSLVEQTRGSEKKRYDYTGEKTLFDPPVVVKIRTPHGIKEIKYRYKSVIERANHVKSEEE